MQSSETCVEPGATASTHVDNAAWSSGPVDTWHENNSMRKDDLKGCMVRKFRGLLPE